MGLILTKTDIRSGLRLSGTNGRFSLSVPSGGGGGGGAGDGTVSTGLQFYVNAENATSYPGSGTTWFDLSGNGNNVILSNGPTFNGSSPKSFTFDGTNDIGIASSSVSFTVSSFTSNVWINRDSGGESRQQILGFAGNGAFDPVNMGIGILNDYVYFNTGADIPQGQFTAAGTLPTGTWYNLCLTHESGAGFSLYVNGSFISTLNSGNNSLVVTAQRRIVLGGAQVNISSTSREYKGKIGAALTYLRKLSDAEVLENYNALKGQYGL